MLPIFRRDGQWFVVRHPVERCKHLLANAFSALRPKRDKTIEILFAFPPAPLGELQHLPVEARIVQRQVLVQGQPKRVLAQDDVIVPEPQRILVLLERSKQLWGHSEAEGFGKLQSVAEQFAIDAKRVNVVLCVGCGAAS